MTENRTFRDLLTGPSKAKYLAWRILRVRRELTVTLKNNTRLILRPLPRDDYGVAYEVFVMNCYGNPMPLDASEIRCIVDLGANVGYSCVFWGSQYPDAQVVAFEPHPDHVDLLRRNLELNRLTKHVTVHAAAAGSRPGTGFLADGGASSGLLLKDREGAIPIPVVDFFDTIGDRRIDLLKMDIEGAEYDLIEDPRFGRLNVGALVLEWHITPDHRDGLQWCTERLTGLGFAVTSATAGSNSGVLWGTRNGRTR